MFTANFQLIFLYFYISLLESTSHVPSSIWKNVASDKKVAGEIERFNWSRRPSEKYKICLTPGCRKAGILTYFCENLIVIKKKNLH